MAGGGGDGWSRADVDIMENMTSGALLKELKLKPYSIKARDCMKNQQNYGGYEPDRHASWR